MKMQRSVLIHVAVLVWLALLTTALIAKEPPLASVEGQVIARETGRPIPHARVWVGGGRSDLKWEWSRSVQCDENGAFRLDGVRAGNAYFSAAGHIHHLGKDQWVLLHEGSGNSVILALAPVTPYLRLRMAQHVLTPDETPTLTCAGYTTGDRLTLAVRRFPLSALRNKNESP